MKLRRRLGLSRTRQAQLARAMQLVLVAIVVVGVLFGEVGLVVNAVRGSQGFIVGVNCRLATSPFTIS